MTKGEGVFLQAARLCAWDIAARVKRKKVSHQKFARYLNQRIDG